MDKEKKTNGIDKVTIRERKLPHWQKPGAYYFLTFSTLHNRKLSKKSKTIVLNALKYFEGQRYELISAIVMSNHCHCIIHPLEQKKNVYYDVSKILKNIKGFTAREINKNEGNTGEKLWLKESYDRIIRDDKEMENYLEYIDFNAIKAGLSDKPGAYEWYYFTDKYFV